MPFSVQNFKSKFSFRGVPEGNRGIFLKNIVTIQYLGRNKLYTRTLLRVFIAHEGRHDALMPDLKVREQLEPFLVRFENLYQSQTGKKILRYLPQLVADLLTIQ
jgi:hypothetical protein